jgi:PfaD family protein
MKRDLPDSGLFWSGKRPAFEAMDLAAPAAAVRETLHIVRGADGRLGVASDGELASKAGPHALPLVATLPPLYPEWLGERSFGEAHGVRFPYVAGEMANGIATARMVAAMADAGMLGFFGAAGLSYANVEKAVDELVSTIGDAKPWGVNLIHSPSEAALEERVADLLIRRGVTRASASAFLSLTPAVVRYAVSGLGVDAAGEITRKHHLFAKVSRPEVARHFLSPAPRELVEALLAKGLITREEALLAARVPVAEDITVEADSGGHTDNRPLVALLPLMLQLRDELAAKHGFERPIRIGAAGGLSTPASVAAAFGLGAAYVLTGSVNQAAVESGLSDEGKQLLARAGIADVMMAPAADMFELGVKVQVLRTGTLFGIRALKLYEAYQQYSSLEALPAGVRAKLEKETFRASLDEIWTETRRFWSGRDAKEVDKAERDPRHKMALVFRWYLGKSSRWAIDGEPERKLDYQIWCGPAMGSFNAWAAGSFLAAPERRTVVQIARNLLEGAAVITRAQQLRSYGVAVPDAAFRFSPRPLD